MKSAPLRALIPILGLLFLAVPASAQVELQTLPPEWPHLDLSRDGFAGISTFRAYEELLADREPQRSVIVAVIDSGVDTTHTGLAGRLWVNPYLSHTGRGFAGDRHGWNFLGNSAGENVLHDTFEYVREYVRLRPRFAHVDPAHLDEAALAEYAHFTAMRDSLAAKREEFLEYRQMIAMADMARRIAHDELTHHFGSPDYRLEQVLAIESDDPHLLQAQEIALFLAYNQLDEARLAEQAEYVEGILNYSLNVDFDPRHIVGDNYHDLSERYYGNPDVHGPDPSHGTGVASIIAARHDGEFSVAGVASDSVFIMAIRAVPQGDERDKDVANAIRYAVDHGAHIINMSFGKPVSPQKHAVDAAVRHAMERGVLMIHAAGNDAWDRTRITTFPTRALDDGTEAELWIEVGASTAHPEMLAAAFSNYGAGAVDVFAPGEDVWVLEPGQRSGPASGTSFAAPHVAGLAALLMSHFPELSAAQVRAIILETAVRFDVEVLRPGSSEQLVPFSSLSTTGGIINVYEAVKRAKEVVGDR